MRANLCKANLSHANGFKVDLSRADLTRANLCGAYLQYADLTSGNLSEADLSNADLSNADLSSADLSKANLSNANLTGASMVKTKINGAILSGCKVYGISAWDLEGLDTATQKDLKISTYHYTENFDCITEPDILVDNLEVAQFVYLMLNSQKIRNVIDTIGQKGVLILGRFGERKHVLDSIRGKLRSMGYVPFVFDFEKPTNRDFTETVKILAGMSKFIIADITMPKSVPLELQAIVPDYEIPLVPIIQEGERPFSMFTDILKKDWVVNLLSYTSVEELLGVFEKAVVNPANAKVEYIQMRNAKKLCMRKASQYKE